MLRLVTGSSPDEKLNMYSNEISAIVRDGKQVICIVPDQFSFEFDKILYSVLGARDFNMVSVQSFKKLSESLISAFGTDKGILARPEERAALIYLALRRVKQSKKLRILARTVERPAFIPEIESIIDSIIRAQLSASDLRACAQKLSGSLSSKLEDVADIFEAYSEVLSERGLRDESSIVSLGTALAGRTEYFRDKYVYVDRFDSYSQDELSLLEQAVISARSVSVSVTLPKDYKPSAASPYAVAENTQKKLVGIAVRNNTRLVYSYCREAEKPQGLEYLKRLLSGEEKRHQPVSDGSIQIISAPAVYEEADFVAAEIRRLVSEGGFTYNDIAVITRDMSSYQTALESAFERFDVPYYTDSKQRAADMSVIIFALNAIDAASGRKLSSEKLLRLMRSPFSGYSEEEISVIEDYCVRWNVDGDMWTAEFTVGSEDVPLEKLNDIRARLVSPLIRLKEDCAKADAKGICIAFNKYIEQSGLAENAAQIINDCADTDDKLEAARAFKQLWNALMSAVTAVYTTVGETEISLKEFGELLRLILCGTSISNPPQKLSCVMVYDAARSVIASPKVAFVVGVNDSRFPLDSKKTGIFSGKDSAAMEAVGISFDMGDLERLDSERSDCFRALTCAGEKLYISYSEADPTGKPLRPSYYVNKLSAGAEIKPVKSFSFPTELYSSTPAAAYYRLAVERNGSPAELESLKNALFAVPEYADKLRAVSTYGKETVRRLSPDVAKRLFASRDINITASRIDVYNKCNFEYFMRYGLDIKKISPVAVDPAGRGSVMHYVFQKVLEHYGADFERASDDELKALIDELLERYKQEMLGGDFGKTAVFKADYARLASACLEILVNIREEYKVSKFRPERYEYDLSKEDGRSVLSVPINRNLRINIRGIVDRVDTYTSPSGSKYIRIVDYKTGPKELRFEDLYNGLNLQMLLYMIALTQGSDLDFSGFFPAGILYMKAGFLECSEEAEPGYSPVSDDSVKRLKLCASQLKRSGLIVEDDSSIEAMDSGFSGLYAPVVRNKDGSYSKHSSLISSASFKLLEDFALQKVREFGSGLIMGKISPVPCGRDSKHLACAYCDYSSVCDRRKYMYKLISSADGDKLKTAISVKEEASNARLDW